MNKLLIAAITFAAANSVMDLEPAHSATALPVISVPNALQCTEGGTVGWKITRTGSKTTTASFRYETLDITAKAGIDYTSALGQQSVRKNTASYTITLRCGSQDTIYKGNRTFEANITAISGATVGNFKTIVTVLEDDPQPPPPPSPLAKPALLTAPQLIGTTTEGQQLMLHSRGTWSGSPTGYTITWSRGFTQVPGQSSPTYMLTAPDVGSVIRAGVVACNAAGCAFSYSNALGPVVAAPVIEQPPADGWYAYPISSEHRGLHRALYARALDNCPAIFDGWGPPLLKNTVYKMVGYGVALRLDGVHRSHWSVIPEGSGAITTTNMTTVDELCLVGLYKAGDPQLPWTSPSP